ncbi:MAG TPA: hypothetical protein VFZ10_08240, partial [Geminicoccaceae bacterium]
MTSDDRLVRTHSRLSGWQLVGAAYRLLRDHGREAVNIATVPTLIAIANSLVFSWAATGTLFWNHRADFDGRTMLWLMLFGAAYLWISGIIFDRWTRHLLGTKKPVRPERPTFWSSWVLGCLVLGVGFAVIVAIVGIVLAPTGSVLFALIVSMPLAWVLSNLAAARLLLKASLRASFLTTRPVLSEFVLQDWSRSGWAYAIAPLPFLLGSILLGKLADAVGGWVSVGWHLVEPVNGTISTLLIAAIGVVSIRSSMAGAVY